MISAILATALLMAQAAPAGDAGASASPPPSAPGATAAVAPAKAQKSDELICHSEEVLGTRFPKKICYTRSELADRSRQDQENLNHMQSMSHSQ